MCTHIFKKHGVLNVVQRYAIRNQCRACLKTYHEREQLIHHLKYRRTGCLVKLIATVAPMSSEDLQECLDQQHQLRKANRNKERIKQHKYPVSQASGPMRPWPWQRSAVLAHQDQREAPSEHTPAATPWIHELLEVVATQDVAGAYELLMQHVYDGRTASTILQAFQQHKPQAASLALEQYLVLHDALLLWQDTHIVPPTTDLLPDNPESIRNLIQELRPIDQNTQTAELPVQFRRHLLANRLWLETSVQWQIRIQLGRERRKQYVFPTVVPRSVVQNPIYLYVFAGRRRDGDYQSQVETLLQQHGQPGQILLLDLALSDKHDVSQPQLVQHLLSWIDSGSVAGLLVAPPCESWSEARFITPQLPSDPRPVRSAQDPFSMPQLTIAELEQVIVANYLLYVAIMLMFRAAMKWVPSILEHPREPSDSKRPTIWKLPWIQMLKDAGLLSQRLIWQAHYGSTAPKPTHLGIQHLPQFNRVMARHRRWVNWSSLEHLGGRDSEGRWRTARAKEYPPDLNKALADLHVSEAVRRVRERQAAPPVPDTVQQQFNELYAGHLDYQAQVMQPDFHRRDHLTAME